jgi:hypothetical protein
VALQEYQSSVGQPKNLRRSRRITEVRHGRARNDSSFGRLCCHWPEEICNMTDDRTVPPFVYEGLDPVAEPKSAIAQASELLSEAVEMGTSAIHRVGDAIDKGRKPGMPLSILSSVAREAPLGSLLVAFLAGVAIGRRR